MSGQKYFIIGTAGHIDHGKSALVKLLTGTDPDRLSEEQERGMTIDLGFAFLNDQIAIIDVPGHERFIKNMVAGVSTIDMVMLVIAADDGVMPQTREHLDILQMMQVKHGIIVVTKTDLVDQEWLEIVKEDIGNLVKNTFLQNSQFIHTSTVTRQGIDELRQLLIAQAEKLPARKNRGPFWMPVDRAFTIKGHGTVVTGSILSGSVSNGAQVEMLPNKNLVRIRGIQTHGHAVEGAGTGERAAINLAGISRTEIIRGDILASPQLFNPSNLFDVRLQLLKNAPKPVRNRTRVRVHLGTREIMARVRLLDHDQLAPGESGYAQLQLEEQTAAMRRDPFVIRQYSPLLTIGGGTILATNPKPHKRFHQPTLQTLAVLEKEDPKETIATVLQSAGNSGLSPADLEKQTGLEPADLDNYLEEMVSQNQVVNAGTHKKPVYLHLLTVKEQSEKMEHLLKSFHDEGPLRPGMNKAELMKKTGCPTVLFEFLLDRLAKDDTIVINHNLVKLASHRIILTSEQEKTAAGIMQALEAGGYAPPELDDIAKSMGKNPAETENLVYALISMDKVIRIREGLYYPMSTYESARKILIDEIMEHGEITVSRYRDLTGGSRKYALDLLQYFDSTGLTQRVDDVRILN